MATGEKFERVLANLYRAAVGDVEWVSVAASINDLIGTNGHSVTFAEVGPRGEPRIHFSRFFVGAEHRDDLQQLYYRDYFWRDEAIPRLYGLGESEMVEKSDLYTDREKKKSATYNEFRVGMETQNGFFMGLHGPDGQGIVLSFGNSTERTGWGHDQIQAIKSLAPHMRHFARVRHAMADAEALSASLGELLETRRLGIVQLDRTGRVKEANDRARNILLKRDGVGERGGVLAAGHPAENAELRSLLARALPADGAQGLGGSMKITRRKARAPLVLEVHPIQRMGADHHASQLAALVLIVDPVARPRVDADLVAEVLGLTAAESLVAVALATGETVAGIAHAQGCAESTVRTHVKRIYRKLGIRKQTELLQRIMSLEGLRKSFG